MKTSEAWKIGSKLWFVRPFAFLPAVNAAIDGVDGTPDGFLDEVRRQVSFLAESVVQRISGFDVRGDAVFVVGVVPAVVTSLVRTIQELLGGFVEVVVILVGNDELDRRGTSNLYVSDVVSTVLNDLRVSRLLSRGLYRGVSASSANSLRASDRSEALAP